MMPECFKAKMAADLDLAKLREAEVIYLTKWQEVRDRQAEARRDCRLKLLLDHTTPLGPGSPQQMRFPNGMAQDQMVA